MTDFDWFDGNLTTWLEYWRKAEDLVKGDELMEYHLIKSGALILYHRYFHIREERYGMQFSWIAGSDFVHPVCVPKESGNLAKELAYRTRSPNRIILSEPPLRARYDNVEIDLCNNGYNVSKKSSSKFTAGITQDMTGRIGYLVSKTGENFVDGNFGGIDFITLVGAIDRSPTLNYVLKKEAADYISLTKEQIDPELEITKNINVMNDGLHLVIKFKNSNLWNDEISRNVASFALYLNDTHELLIRLNDEEEWKRFIYPKGQKSANFGFR